MAGKELIAGLIYLPRRPFGGKFTSLSYSAEESSSEEPCEEKALLGSVDVSLINLSWKRHISMADWAPKRGGLTIVFNRTGRAVLTLPFNYLSTAIDRAGDNLNMRRFLTYRTTEIYFSHK